ncbi:hypothetical protein A4U53_030505 [Rhizobium ruizarguesonis]|uniref:Uncharacterized protein n=1 Tax=Rhizobium ruizarguesonis TaxID=2081791 RepID=A0ACD5EMC0_9HYPH
MDVSLGRLGGSGCSNSDCLVFVATGTRCRKAASHHGEHPDPPNLHAGKKAAETSANIRVQCEETLGRWQVAKLPQNFDSLRSAIERLKFLRDLVDRTEFVRVQTEIEFTHMRHEQLISSIEEATRGVERDFEEINIERVPIAREAVVGSHKNAVMYLQQVHDICNSYVSDFDRITEHLR